MNSLALAIVSGMGIGVLSGLQAQEDLFVAKGRVYSQTSAAAPSPVATSGALFVAQTSDMAGMVTDASVQLPGGSVQALTHYAGEEVYRFVATANSPAALSATYPAGTYQLSLGLMGFPMTGVGTLTADNFPAPPQVVNYTAAQSIDAAADFEFTFQSLAGATEEQTVQITLLQGSTVILADVVSATETAWTLYADTLAADTAYELRLRYGRYETDYSGMLPASAGFFSETRLAVTTAGGGGTDTTPPVLMASYPADGATNASPIVPVSFAFSEPMDPTKITITWSSLLDPAKFGYSWTDGNQALVCTYTGGLPSGTHTWILNPVPNGPNSFRDVAGNPLPTTTGSFKVSGGGGGCEGETPIELAGFALFKGLSYVQNGTGTPQTDPDGGGMFIGTYGTPMGGGGEVNVTLEFPAPPAPQPHTVKTYTQSIAGYAYLIEEFADQAQLDAAYPNVAYAVQLRNASGTVTNSATLTFTASSYPPIPRFANFTAAQAVDPAADFTLSWDAFTGTGTNRFITILVLDETGQIVFELPDACAGRLLPVTATSAVIPRNTLATCKTYTARLTFFNLVDQGKTLAGNTGVAGADRQTDMPLKTTGCTPASQPKFLSIKNLGGNLVELKVELTAGRPFTLLRGASPLLHDVTVLTTNPPSSPITLTVPMVGKNASFRGRTD
ncbi:MAG TPA: Ig-like domain-containing protein [Verrucomicrobiota bacterium]|nr:Ig-like domain-containing protein [Verrucomicrobiota bacterium]HNU52695.1 Ig-like domain-containing protein [Verrucomicrobiota bacterium]